MWLWGVVCTWIFKLKHLKLVLTSKVWLVTAQHMTGEGAQPFRFMEELVGAYHNTSPEQLPTSGRPAERSKHWPISTDHGSANTLRQALLAIADKDVDHIALVSQSQLLLLRDSNRNAHSNSNPPNSNATNQLQKRSPRPLGSPLPALATLQPAHSHLTTAHRRTTVAHASQPNAARASLAFIRNLRGCLSKYRNQRPTSLIANQLPKEQLSAGSYYSLICSELYIHVSHTWCLYLSPTSWCSDRKPRALLTAGISGMAPSPSVKIKHKNNAILSLQ
jgi:hypothetical protein